MPRGDCYEAAGRFLLDNGGTPLSDDYRLVHAEVRGQGPLEGKTFGHAWVENLTTGWTFDYSNDRQIMLPTPAYRKVAGVDEIGNEHRYDHTAALRKMAQTGVWGPWDLVTSSGL